MKTRDIMTSKVISVTEDTPVQEVAQLLDRHRVSGLPVCDGAGHVVGVISEYDVIAKREAETAGAAMTRDVISVMEDTDVEDVRYLLVDRKIKRVPVLRGQTLVGIVSRADLVRQIAHTWMCQVCGDEQHGTNLPDQCPKCGVRGGYQFVDAPPEVAERCPTCGHALP